MRWLCVWLLLQTSACSVPEQTFTCRQHAECGAEALCLYASCASPDTTCRSGARYFEYAAAGLSDDCVACRPAVGVAAGGAHSCLVNVDGQTHCWGKNDEGQLGAGLALQPQIVKWVDQGVARFARMALGRAHGCAIVTPNGEVVCWGSNTFEQLGAAAVSSSVRPILARSAAATAIAARGDRTCALFLDGLECWGGLDAEVPNTPPQDLMVAELAVGVRHTCVLTTPGDVVCWGEDLQGQLGVPTPLGRGKQLAAGDHHTCVVVPDGTAMDSVSCWGRSDEGQVQGAAMLPAGLSLIGIAAGAAHSCVLDSDGDVRCWGAAQLGAPEVTIRLPGATAIAAGGDHTCALLGDGRVRCWGDDSFGQLGSVLDGGVVEHCAME